MRAPAGPRARGAFTIVEVAITLGVLAVLTAIALPSIDFARFRMDGAARAVQLRFIAAQSKAVAGNVSYMVTFFWTQDQFRVVNDINADGLWSGGSEVRNWFSLPQSIHFKVPPSTIDGAAPDYATGPGLHTINTGGNAYPTMNFYPNGSSSGDVVVYLGTRSARLTDFRAIQITGATSKVRYWRLQSDGQWKLSDM